MFVTFGQPKEYKQLYSFTKSLRDISQKMLERAKAASEFGKSLLILLKTETPKYAIYFEPIMKEYEKLSISYAVAAKIQNLAMEDLNDIIIRYPVVQRKEQEKVKLIQAYNLSNKKYKEAKLYFNKSPSQENQLNLIRTRNERAKIAQILIDKSDENDAYQERFDRFVQNRSTSAWKRFGFSMEKLYREETEIMTNISSYCNNFRNNIDDPESILQFSLSKIEQTNQALKVNKNNDFAANQNEQTKVTNEQNQQCQNSQPQNQDNQQDTKVHQNQDKKTHQNPDKKAHQNQDNQQNQKLTNAKIQPNQNNHQIKLNSDMDDEEFKKLAESMELDIGPGFNVDGIEYINSDSDHSDPNDNSGGGSPTDLNIDNMVDDDFIRDLLDQK